MGAPQRHGVPARHAREGGAGAQRGALSARGGAGGASGGDAEAAAVAGPGAGGEAEAEAPTLASPGPVGSGAAAASASKAQLAQPSAHPSQRPLLLLLLPLICAAAPYRPVRPPPRPEPTLLPGGVGPNSTFAALGNYLQQQSRRHPHGHLYVRGAAHKFQFFRATYGGLLPCGSRDLVVPPNGDAWGCVPLAPHAAASAATGPAPSVLGRYLLVRRGNCSFTAKALNAQRAGAAGVIVLNSEPGLLRMAMSNATEGFEVVVPLVMASLADFGPLIEYASARGLPLHGTLGPVRDECVDPQAEDEERRKYAEEGGVAFTAALASRVSPRRAESLRFGVAASPSPSPSSRSGPDGAGARDAGTDTSAESAQFLLQSWPAIKTQVALLHVGLSSDPAARASAVDVSLDAATAASANEGQGERCGAEFAPYLPATDAETYLAEFSAPVLGESGELVFAEPPRACGNITNVPALAGKFVIVLRGECTMVDKARALQAAGARAVVLVNYGAEAALLSAAAAGPDEIAASAAAAAAAAAAAGLADSSLLPATSTHSNPSFGVVQAMGDSDLAARPVLIPVVMVSAASASAWAWEAAGGSVGSVVGCVATLVPSRAQASVGWEELELLRAGGAGSWPEDAFQRQRMMLRLLRLHHAKAALGHPERHQFLLESSDAVGVGFELRDMESGLQWEDGSDLGHVSDDFGRDKRVRTLAGGSPGLGYLIANLPAAGLIPRWVGGASNAGTGAEAGEAAAGDVRAAGGIGLMRCQAESGNSYSVKLSDFDRTSTFGIARRLKDLLAQQVCLEKLLIANAATLGAYLGVMREEMTVREWREVTRGLLRGYKVRDADVSRLMSSYIELSRSVSALVGNEGTVGAAFRLDVPLASALGEEQRNLKLE